MAAFDLASASDLVRWADRLESRSRLPQLIRRLIATTGKELTAFSARAGEGVQLQGWDGKVEAKAEDAHVPSGVSAWEMGVDKVPASKAKDDYKKRTADPKGVDPADATYVFVTPRRWSGKDAWVAERMAEGEWKAVRVYDADDLEAWLERAPGVHAWFSALLGKDPHEVESLEAWWESWSNATVPPIPPVLLLSGRDEVVASVRTLVQGEAGTVTLSSDSQEEAIAFVAAGLHGEGTGEVLGRAVIVRTPGAWRRMAVSEQLLVLLPLFENPDVALAVRSGHHVIVPMGRELGGYGGEELPRLRRHGIEAALIEAGLPRERASRLATLGRRSLLSLRRTLAIGPAVQAPEWSRPEHIRDILPALLAGQWLDGREADREAVSKLAGRPYEEVSHNLVRWSNTSDPPVRRVGDVWLVAAKKDAWDLSARHLTPDDLARFREVTVEVLGADDPSLDLDPKERVMAPVLGKIRPFSGHLTKGIAETVALMGAASDAVPLSAGRRSQDEAATVVRELLTAANEDSTGRRWITLSDSLPLLAEAAPETFLSAVEEGLQEAAPLASVFQDHGEGFDAFLSGSSAHTGLLWALETLAWSSDYIVRATLALAKLALADPGGRLSNRPDNSIREVFVLWAPGTAAPLERRLQAIDLIRRRQPDISWKLLLRLLPTGHDVAHPPHAPDWRDWKPDDAGSVTYVEVEESVAAIAERVLADAGQNGQRWASVTGRYADFTPSFQARIVERLLEFEPASFSPDERRSIADAAREVVGRHRAHPQARWALPGEDVDRLETCIERLAPSDPQHRHRWLFVQGAIWNFREGDEAEGSRDEQLEALDAAQTSAAADVYSTGGVAAILAWSEQLEVSYGPFEIGRALGSAPVSPEDEAALLDALNSESPFHCQVARGFIARQLHLQGTQWPTWIGDVLAAHPEWTPTHKAELLTVAPATPAVWDLAEREGPETDMEYWHRMRPFGLPERGVACVRAAHKLVEHRNPHSAVDLLGLYDDDIPGGPPDELVAEALEKAATTPPIGPVGQMFTHYVGQHLDRLAEHSFDENRLAELEWMYLPAFRFEKRKSPVLHRALSSDPSFFVQVVSWVYRAEGEEPEELSEQEMTRARTAHDLLDSWREVPGTKEDGTIDGAALREWVSEARRLLEECGRLGIGDDRIGQVLRYGPPPQKDEWPAEVIRDLIEDVASEELEDGLRVEIYNSRGTTSRGLTDGGDQERELVERYRRYAATASTAWPRTSAVLNRVADSYERDARRHDLDADLTEDLWR